MRGGPSFEELVRTRATGVAFVPLLEEIAPRVDGGTRAETTADPTLWATSIERAAALVGADAVTIGWDESILAEACGVPIRWEDDRPVLGGPPPSLRPAAKASGRVPAFLETARRLAATARHERGCLVALPGPASLAERVLGPAVDRQSLAALKSILVGVAEAICQSRPDGLALVENGGLKVSSPEIRRIYATLRNVADHYGVAMVLYVEGYEDLGSATATAASLKIGHLMVGPNHAGLSPDPAAVVRAAADLASVAVPLPLRDAETALLGALAALEAARSRPAVYFTTPGPIPRHSDIGLLREVGEAVRAIVH